jgi:hypothetical protein
LTSQAELDQFISCDKAYKIFVQKDWLEAIKSSILYGYEFDGQNFNLLADITHP